MVETSFNAEKVDQSRNLFSYESKNLVREGDLVLFYESMDLSKQMVIKRGG